MWGLKLIAQCRIWIWIDGLEWYNLSTVVHVLAQKQVDNISKFNDVISLNEEIDKVIGSNENHLP